MSSSAFFPFPGRRRRKWFSTWEIKPIHNSLLLYVYRYPVKNGRVLFHCKYLHRQIWLSQDHFTQQSFSFTGTKKFIGKKQKAF